MTEIIFGAFVKKITAMLPSASTVFPPRSLSVTSRTDEKLKVLLWNLILKIFTKVRRNFPIQLKSGQI